MPKIETVGSSGRISKLFRRIGEAVFDAFDTATYDIADAKAQMQTATPDNFSGLGFEPPEIIIEAPETINKKD